MENPGDPVETGRVLGEGGATPAAAQVPEVSRSTAGKGTIEFALRAHRVEATVLQEEHADVLGMIESLLGVTPRHCRYLKIWPPAYKSMSALVPNLLDIPFCDFGLGSIDGSLRSLAAYTSSRTYGCGYCSAHCAAMGTIWNGNNLYLEKNAMAMMDEPDPSLFTPRELAAIRISKKLGPVPTKLTSDDIREMASVFSYQEQESVVLCAVVMGFLNRFMDTVGMPLELQPLETCKHYLTPTGWTPESCFDPEADEELTQEDREEALNRVGKKNKWCGSIQFFKMMAFAKMEDNAILGEIPRSDRGIAQKCIDAAGFLPYFLSGKQRMKRENARLAFAWAFALRLCQGSEEVPVEVKQMMCYTWATRAGNNILRAHYAFMAHRNGVSISKLEALSSSSGSSSNPDGGDNPTGDVRDPADNATRTAAALAFARATTSTPSTVPPELVQQLMFVYSPPGIIELVTTVSMANMFHRWTSVFKPLEFEPEILAFVREYGPELSISENPCLPEESGWYALISNIRE